MPPRSGLVALAAVLLASACVTQAEESTQSEAFTTEVPAAALFSAATKRVVIEIDYQPGAEPFFERTAALDDPWKVFRDNAAALLGEDKEIVLPSGLEDMERLDDLEGDSFGDEDLVQIAARHRNAPKEPGTISYYFVFLNGHYRDDVGDVLTQIPGVSVRGKPIVGLYKPAITAHLENPDTPIYMEQTTLVHEFGHVVGLVDRGIEPTSDHRATDHGAHCDNPSCIMYWENLLVKDGVDFADTYLRPRSGVLFGSECLRDIRAFARSRTGER